MCWSHGAERVASGSGRTIVYARSATNGNLHRGQTQRRSGSNNGRGERLDDLHRRVSAAPRATKTTPRDATVNCCSSSTVLLGRPFTSTWPGQPRCCCGQHAVHARPELLLSSYSQPRWTFSQCYILKTLLDLHLRLAILDIETHTSRPPITSCRWAPKT